MSQLRIGEKREGRAAGEWEGGVYPAVFDSALLPKAAFAHHNFLKYVCHSEGEFKCIYLQL